MQYDFLKEIKDRQEDFFKDLQGFLKIKSELKLQLENEDAPFGEEIDEALEYMIKLGQREGMETLNYKHLGAHIEMGEGDEYIGLIGHVDVVPAGSDWSFDPYGAEIKDGYIYGRGTQDDKGPTIAAFYAMKIIKELGIDLDYRVRLILGPDEESGWRGLPTYFENNEHPAFGFVPDSSFPGSYAEKGIMIWKLTGSMDDSSKIVSFDAGLRPNMVPDRATVVLTGVNDAIEKFNEYLIANNYTGSVSNYGDNITLSINGVSVHGAVPQLGVNAAFLMVNFLINELNLNDNFLSFIEEYLLDDSYGEKLGIAIETEEMGKLSLNTGVVNVENGEFNVILNPRYPKGFDFDKTYATVESKMKKHGINIESVEHKEPHYVSPKSHLVQTLLGSYQKFTNDFDNLPESIGGGTYSRLVPNMVAFGAQFPGFDDRMHQLDERAKIDDLILATAIYADALVKLGQK